ncbi:hypothetical protein CEUSTIGMA_g4867.t1 [Chlamydomonas eustigma]|uniref:F-box domain-containing protein n=1 Tax=Chlamydomonas eustigma TaxID=1157962 RepID=A0A250X3E1_9CHLO|nr:hypothetical protein CEUSTIGMA_g4867.t1 [Chlamydomonas eustigma]|eukprot:GAX77422.1 hypothetical protein CEUSTIGMA_g4867.t1 [Chlamydomonas eustigma]
MSVCTLVLNLSPLFQLVARYLHGTQLLRARAVDKRWRAAISNTIRTVVVSPRQWADSPRNRSQALAQAFKGVNCVQIVLDANRNPRYFDPLIIPEALAPFTDCADFNSLHLVWRTWILPNEGYSEEHFDTFVERWSGLGSLLDQGFKGILPLLAPRLKCLDLNAQSNMLKMLLPQLSSLSALTSLRYSLSDHYTLCSDDARVLSNLVSLKTLFIRCWLTSSYSDLLIVALRTLTNLCSLEIDAINIPPEENIAPRLNLLTELTGLTSLCAKGLGFNSILGLSSLSSLRELTLSVTDVISKDEWCEVASLQNLSSLNINAWEDMTAIPSDSTSNILRAQSCEHMGLLAGLPLKSFSIRVGGPRDLSNLSTLTGLTNLVIALQPLLSNNTTLSPTTAAAAAAAAAAASAAAAAGPAGAGAAALAAASAALAAASRASGLQVGSPYSHHTGGLAGGSAGCLSFLSQLQSLRCLEILDTGSHIRLTQSLLQDMAGWWGNLTSLYFEGVISIKSLSNISLPSLRHLAFINISPQPFRLDLGLLPPRLDFLELQNAVVVHIDSAPVKELGRRLTNVSMMKGITWMDLTDSQTNMSWLAGCSLLTSLRLDFSMGWWSDALQSCTSYKAPLDARISELSEASCVANSSNAFDRSREGDAVGSFKKESSKHWGTPLGVLSLAPALMFMDLMLVDSSESSEGLLDNRLIKDLARLERLEELQVWTRLASDWHEDINFLPLARDGRSHLRLLEMEVLPHGKALVCRDVLSAALPSCRFRLVADRIGELIS